MIMVYCDQIVTVFSCGYETNHFSLRVISNVRTYQSFGIRRHTDDRPYHVTLVQSISLFLSALRRVITLVYNQTQGLGPLLPVLSG